MSQAASSAEGGDEDPPKACKSKFIPEVCRDNEIPIFDNRGKLYGYSQYLLKKVRPWGCWGLADFVEEDDIPFMSTKCGQAMVHDGKGNWAIRKPIVAGSSID